MTSYIIHKTFFGDLLLVANARELTGLYFDECAHAPSERRNWVLDPKHPVLREAAAQLDDYFAGKRSAFTVPLRLEGTPFQRRVWQAIARIPFGKTISYSELADNAGNARAIRAAGTNTGRNPIGIIIPCHRVLEKSGGLGGFAGGLDWKRHLLAIEQKFSR